MHFCLCLSVSLRHPNTKTAIQSFCQNARFLCRMGRNASFSSQGVPTVSCFINFVHATYAASFSIESRVGFKIALNGFRSFQNLSTPTLEHLRDLPGASFWVPLGVLDYFYSLLEGKLSSLSFRHFGSSILISALTCNGRTACLSVAFVCSRSSRLLIEG